MLFGCKTMYFLLSASWPALLTPLVNDVKHPSNHANRALSIMAESPSAIEGFVIV
jgi:hypothetical protein